MFSKLLSKFIGNRNERLLQQCHKIVALINNLEPDWQSLSDQALRQKTSEFRNRLGSDSLDILLPEAFATVREVSRRVLDMRHFDVQLIGGIVLHNGKIAEMRTGEGKTLVAILTAYLNALSGQGVHIVTINDYLAQRDADWMKPVYNFLGLSTGVIKAGLTTEQRQIAYAADITYGTNNEFGFDYLRDNMAFNLTEKSQRELHFAIVDEVDSILIDEARTPLIISGSSEDSSELYVRINSLIPQFTCQGSETPGDFTLDEKTKQAYLTEQGYQKLEQLLIQEKLLDNHEDLYSSRNINLIHHVYAALRAHHLFHRDVDYIVQPDQITIVDEHTGRLMPGRRWSDGLHQAIEAKEQVSIQNENQTLASITFQNYFRLYKKLSGMTGTADTEAYEFQQIYGLEVVVIPTNQPVRRKDLPDKIYLTLTEKFNAIITDIQVCRQQGQPVLIGTASIESSEHLSSLLQQHAIPHQVLNAKFHEREAQIIAEAGRPGAVTIATNMAGRGTDIVLGGSLNTELAALPSSASVAAINKHKVEWQSRHDRVVAAGGLHIIGSERHESRRIDNQLRGRAGRQGDPGTSRFYLSLQDNLLRIFASERMGAIMQRLGMQPGEAIEHPWITRAIENAQRKVEGRNFDIRKQLLEFDDVANEQRKVIYQQRNELLAAETISDLIPHIRADVIRAVILHHIPAHSPEEHWDIPGLEIRLKKDFNLDLLITQWLAQEPELAEETLFQRILTATEQAYTIQINRLGPATLVQLEKSIMLQTLDNLWKEHLATMEYLRQGIHLRGYAQKNPKQEYKQEAFELFTKLLEQLKYQLISHLSSLEIQPQDIIQHTQTPRQLDCQHPNNSLLSDTTTSDTMAIAPTTSSNLLILKTGRNEPCPCGSGKKYKHCHGQLS